MMTTGKDTLACKYCKATNVAHRHTCWRCGSTMPYTIGSDGKAHVNRDPSTQTVSRAEIQALLSQAQTVQFDTPRAVSPSHTLPKGLTVPRAFLAWVSGRRSL